MTSVGTYVEPAARPPTSRSGPDASDADACAPLASADAHTGGKRDGPDFSTASLESSAATSAGFTTTETETETAGPATADAEHAALLRAKSIRAVACR